MYKFNCYSIFAIDSNFTKEELDSSFRKNMMCIYKDTTLSPITKKDYYDIIMDDYNTLREPKKRHQYDLDLSIFCKAFAKQVSFLQGRLAYLSSLPRSKTNINKINICILTLNELNSILDNNFDLKNINNIYSEVKQHRCQK